MGKKLAFWGDCNGNGYKIIRILEELGGINASNYGANEVTSLYYIDEKNNIKGTYNGDLDKEKYVVMTYHDFIAKYPHQVYDIVYAVDNHEEGEVVEVVWDETKGRMRYLVTFENSTYWVFADDIFSYEAKDNSDIETTGFMQMGKIISVIFNSANYEDEVELQLGDYEIEIRDGKTYAVRKKPKYPKTYEECCEVLMGKTNFSEFTLVPIKYSNTTKFDNSVSPDAPYMEIFNNLYTIIICRDAYWKIAGEEMRLDKPWKPDWNEETNKFTISNKCNKIYLNNTAWYAEVLSFPTAEMRDAFFKNFKKEIEQCKELL